MIDRVCRVASTTHARPRKTPNAMRETPWYLFDIIVYDFVSFVRRVTVSNFTRRLLNAPGEIAYRGPRLGGDWLFFTQCFSAGGKQMEKEEKKPQGEREKEKTSPSR